MMTAVTAEERATRDAKAPLASFVFGRPSHGG